MKSESKEPLRCHAKPCASCPYRRDTPAGVWAADEYRKLPAYDDQFGGGGIFLCHHSSTAKEKSVCRGWFEVHERNITRRLAVMTGKIVVEGECPCDVPLYDSGAEACRAGIRGVRRPSKAARAMSKKLLAARKAVQQ